MAASPYGRKIRYEQPILVLSAKEFLSGIAASAHAIAGGLFFKAAGVTALNSPGMSDAKDNGLLRAGPQQTEVSGIDLADAPFASCKDYGGFGTGAQTMYLLGNAGHFYQLTAVTDAITDLRSGTPITNPANGMAIMQSRGGKKYLYYMQKGQIGQWDLSGIYPTGWNDSYSSTGINSTVQHPMHNYFDTVLFGNGPAVGSITDNGAADGGADITITPSALAIPADSVVTAIGDDGIYTAIAITNNVNSFYAQGRTKILFWDGAAASWLREYPIDDAYILSVTRVGNAVICQGTKGIYQVSFAGGVKKLLSRRTGMQYTGTGRYAGPALGGTIGQTGYIFGAWFGNEYDATPPICIGTLGVVSDGAPSNFSMPILVTTNTSIDITLLEANFEPYKVFVGCSTASAGRLLMYQWGLATALTPATAKTVYITLPARYKIHRIDVIFGAPLASGDSFSLQTQLSENESAVNFGPTVTYAAFGAIRRKSLYAQTPIVVDEQFSLLFNFNAGNPMIKKIEVYGQLMTP